MRRGGGHGLRTALLAAAVALTVPAYALAQGGYDTEPTREQWVKQANAICKEPYQRAVERLKKVRPLTKRGEYPRAGRVLISVAKIVFDVNGRVAELARPPADARRIAKYLAGERRGAELAKASGQALRKIKVRKAIRLLERADEVTDDANENVKGFGLRHCV